MGWLFAIKKPSPKNKRLGVQNSPQNNKMMDWAFAFKKKKKKKKSPSQTKLLGGLETSSYK